jgi:hypothetical protein
MTRVTGLLIQRGSLNCQSKLLQTAYDAFLTKICEKNLVCSLFTNWEQPKGIYWFMCCGFPLKFLSPSNVDTVYLKICIRYSKYFKLNSRALHIEDPIVLTKVVDKNSTYILYSHKFLVIRKIFEIMKHESSFQSCIKDTFLIFVKFLDHSAAWSNDDLLFSTVRLFWRFGGIYFLHLQGNWGSGLIFYILVALLLQFQFYLRMSLQVIKFSNNGYRTTRLQVPLFQIHVLYEVSYMLRP